MKKVLSPYSQQLAQDSKPNLGELNDDEHDDSLFQRLHRALGPLCGGMILDAADFITLGPIGVAVGLIVGGWVGWWISSIYQYERNARFLWSMLAGLYCAIPFTAILPLATMLSAISRFQKANILVVATAVQSQQMGIHPVTRKIRAFMGR